MKQDPLLIAPACFFMAGKAEESHSKAPVGRVVEAMMRLERRLFGYTVQSVLRAEYEVMQAIGYNVVVFDVYTELRPLLVSCGLAPSVAALETQPLSPVCAAVWSAANDCYVLTDAPLLFAPHVLALACLVVGACVLHRVDLRWWFATLAPRPDLDADMRHVWEVVAALLDAYQLWCAPGSVDRARAALDRLKIPRPEAPRGPMPASSSATASSAPAPAAVAAPSSSTMPPPPSSAAATSSAVGVGAAGQPPTAVPGHAPLPDRRGPKSLVQ